MAALSLDLTPVVDALLDRPFDAAALSRARAAVGGHPQAYATALRCAAKRARDGVSAAYWLAEAARVHESVDDVGGAIALVSRAHQADPRNHAVRELLAGLMSRLCVKVGLGFVVLAVPPNSEGASNETETRHSGLRPPPLAPAEEPRRDTLPDLFAQVASSVPPPPSKPAERLNPSPYVDIDTPLTERPPMTESVILLKPQRAEHRNAMVPPPASDDARESLESLGDALPLTHRIHEEATSKSDPAPTVPRNEPLEATEEDAAVTLLVRHVAAAPEDVYGDVKHPITDRPAGDRLVGALFEALHALHFIENTRDGAAFVQRVLVEKLRPRAVLVHFYEFTRREFVVVSAYGSRAEALVDCGTAEEDPLVAEVLKSTEATHFPTRAWDSRFGRGRWLLVEPERSVLCAPVKVDGRYLGLVEVVDPVDGTEFTEDDRNGVTYVAAAFAQFLSSRRVALEEEELDELAV